MKKTLFLVFALYSGVALCTTITVVNSGTTFSPAVITINLGDSVKFTLASTHNAVEVSQATWNANGTTALSGGFSTSFGGGLVLPANLTMVGTHYYVCTNHASMGMKGTIIVQNSTGIAETQLQPTISVYPNPSNGKFNISLGQSEVVSGSQILKQVQHDISIYNILGEKIYQSVIANSKSEIDLSNQTKGVYFIKIYFGETVLTKKIVIQ